MKDRILALWLTALALGAAAAFFLLYPHTGVDLALRFTPEQVGFLRMFDSTHQQSAHRVLLLALLVSVLLGRYVGRLGPGEIMWNTFGRLSHRAAGLAFAAVTIAAIYPYLRALPENSVVILQGSRYALGFIPSPVAYLLAVVGSLFLLALCSCLARTVTKQRVALGASVVIVAYVIVFFAAPPVLTPNFVGFDPTLITGIEWHYSGQMGPGDRLAAGLRLFDDVRAYSGFLPMLLLALGQRWFGHVDFGTHILIVQLFQILFLGLAVLAYPMWRPRDPAFRLAAVLLVGPWISTLHAAVLYPNQSAWRALAFPLAMVTLLLGQRGAPLRRPVTFGAIVGILVLLNTEVGICAGIGLVLFHLSRTPKHDLWRLPRFLGLAMGGILLSFSAWVLAFRVGIGYWPGLASVDQLMFLVQRFSAGYGGLELKVLEPMALLILCHAAYIVVLYGIRWTAHPLGPRSASRFSVAGMIIIWFAYYAKAPHFWNLWTLLFLYSFLLSAFIRYGYLKALSFDYRRLLRDWRLAALALIILPGIMFPNLLLASSAARVFGPAVIPSDAPYAEVSGVRLPDDFGRLLVAKVEYVRKAGATADGRLIFLTANSFSVPLLSGYFPKMPFQEVFQETTTPEDFALLKNRIARDAPDTILVDEPGSLLAGYPEQQAFFARLMRELSGSYLQTGLSHGWQIWSRRAAGGYRGGLDDIRSRGQGAAFSPGTVEGFPGRPATALGVAASGQNRSTLESAKVLYNPAILRVMSARRHRQLRTTPI